MESRVSLTQSTALSLEPVERPPSLAPSWIWLQIGQYCLYFRYSTCLCLCQLHDCLTPLLSCLDLPRLCHLFPVSHCPRLQQSLYAYVQVRGSLRILSLAHEIFSSLVTGSTSHKLVKSEVSYILSLYYDPVSRMFHLVSRSLLMHNPAEIVPHLCRQRALLRCFVPHAAQKDIIAHFLRRHYPPSHRRNVLDAVPWHRHVLRRVDLGEAPCHN